MISSATSTAAIRSNSSAQGLRILVVLVVWLQLIALVHGRTISADCSNECMVQTQSKPNISAVYELARRWIPEHLVSQLSLEVLDSTSISDKEEDCPCSGSRDIFEYEARTEEEKKVLVIRGTTTAALTAGLGWYFKYECQAHISWTGDQWNATFNGMAHLPIPAQKVRHKRQGKYSYYQNVCTVSYSMVWWDLQRWYREIDWMALSGINMPLAFQGQEIVWQQTFVELGLTDLQVRTWEGGPAFMAWQRMGNIQAWGGPMPQAWMDGQYQLQNKMLERMQSLGMKPTLPAFAGFVPPETVDLFPNANITLSNSWGGFNSSYTPVHLVEATDPLFQTIGTLFLKKQRQLYADYFEASKDEIHYYNADTYNEMDPRSTDLAYLHHAAKSVFTSIRSVDPTGVWVLQGWLFENSNFWTKSRMQAYLSGVDDDGDDDENETAVAGISSYSAGMSQEERLIILDLMSDVYPQYERSDYYFGKSYVYSMLHNFGGNHGLYGRMHVISTDPVDLFQGSNAKESSQNNNIQGVGLTMEGINQNFIVYELMTEMSWRPDTSSPFDQLTDPSISPSPFLSQWTQDYISRRYGLSRNTLSAESVQAVGAAWQQLLKTVYMCPTTQMGVTKSIAVRRPRMANMTHPGFQPTALFYKPEDLHRAWDLLLQAGQKDDSLASLETYRYDLVDITRQVLSDLLLQCHANMLESFQNQKVVPFQAASHRFLNILSDMEKILSTHELFLLETQWLGPARAQAKAHAGSKQDYAALAAVYEFNARNQLTLWGPQGEISDYASKQFAGLMAHYYRPRWELFIKFASDALASRQSKFDDEQFNHACLALEQLWQYRQNTYQTQPEGDTVQISHSLYLKYISGGLDEKEGAASK